MSHPNKIFKPAVLTSRLLLVGMLAVLSSCASDQAKKKSDNAEGKMLPLHTAGNSIVNSKGQKVWLRGVNVASLEWSADGQGRILTTIQTAIRDWHVNIVRVPLCQDRWFGKTAAQRDDGAAYKALVRQVVGVCESNHCYVILDLHWSDCNEWGTNMGQHSMPDHNSLTFWKDFAPVYANNPAVLYDLYNEPHDVSWDVWLNGGGIKDKPNSRRLGPARTYDCVGMQQVLDTIRSTGAKNMVIAGGLDWAYDYSGILKGKTLSDPKGHGVVYANHCYDNKNETVYEWITRMKTAAAQFPVIVSEFGGRAGPSRKMPSDNWLLHVMVALQENQWSFVAWDMHPSAGPTLISDWNYTPTEKFGVYLKSMLCDNKAPEYLPPKPDEAKNTTHPD